MEYYKCIHGKFEGDYCGVCGHIVPRGTYNQSLKANKEPVPEVPCSAGLCLLLKEMRIESVEYLWDYADDIGIRDEQACQFMVSRLEDFFNRKICDLEGQA